MKKILVGLLLFPSLAFGDVRISFDELPDLAKSFINKHFKDFSVLYVERDTADSEYEVKLSSDADITFDLRGDWTKIEAGKKKMPQSILDELPKTMVDYITKEYSVKSITEIRRWNNGYEVEISKSFDDIDLYFDLSGKFIRKDK